MKKLNLPPGLEFVDNYPDILKNTYGEPVPHPFAKVK